MLSPLLLCTESTPSPIGLITLGVKPTGKRSAVNPHAALCVQPRLVCPVGVSPTRVIGQSPVAWMAGVRETDHLKPIDKAIIWMVSESAGRNESECVGGLENA